MSSLDDYRAAQGAEWSQYVAAQVIFIGGARAFNPGDPVPASHVASGVVAKEQVTPVPAAKAASQKGE